MKLGLEKSHCNVGHGSLILCSEIIPITVSADLVSQKLPSVTNGVRKSFPWTVFKGKGQVSRNVHVR